MRSSHLPDRDGEAFPTGHAVLDFMVLRPLSGQTLRLFDLRASTAAVTLREQRDQPACELHVQRGQLTWSDWFSLPSSCMAAVVSSSFLRSSTTLAWSFSISPSPATHLQGKRHRSLTGVCATRRDESFCLLISLHFLRNLIRTDLNPLFMKFNPHCAVQPVVSAEPFTKNQIVSLSVPLMFVFSKSD